MDTAKHRVGRRELYLGLLIDTEKMVITFDPIHTEATALQVASALDVVRGKAEVVPEGDQRSLAGKFNWYAEVLQSGRTRTRMWYLYGRHGLSLYDKQHVQLVDDLSWWHEVLSAWQRGGLSGLEFPILNAETALHDLRVVQSDASGTDGHGYFYGRADEPDPQYVACQWGDTTIYSSHQAELLSLLHYAESTADENCLLVWVSDSSSAVWSVNKGRCREDQGLEVLRRILELLDRRRITVVALWVPREENELADHLSHLALILHRDEARGRISELRDARRGSRADPVAPEP
jgi:hypothetical protein